ncbi:MAG TPA: flagellar hook-length control protein FliK [Solirubrobacteraceae bacterium]|nr:flagellar hook-length control protein FliK [Solirubrobacteraceae bacterium]
MPAPADAPRSAGTPAPGFATFTVTGSVDASQNRGASVLPASAAATDHLTRTDAAATPVPLPRLPETMSATVSTLARAGLSQARISLNPESLGTVQVLLTQTDAGISARVLADHPEAAQALSAHVEELRRSLEATGATVLSLDIDLSGRDGSSNPSAFAFSQPDPSMSGRGNANPGAPGDTGSGRTEAGPAGAEETASGLLQVSLADGALVDVRV